MTTELLTTDEAVAALAEEWRALWQAVPTATPFQSPDWLLPWWAQFGTGRPRVATLRCAGRLVGVLPLYVLDEGETSKLLPFGVGITDDLDALVAPEAAGASGLLAAALAGAEVECCDLPDLMPGAHLLEAAAPPGWTETRWTGPPSPVVALSDSFDGLLRGVSRGTRRYYQQAERRAVAAQVCVERGGPELLPALFDLHARRWRARGEAGVLADARVQAFHRAALPGLLATGAARLEVLHLADRQAAAHLSLLAAGRVFHYLTGFDPAFEAERPGTILLGRLLADAIAEGRREFHFLRGNEAYKYVWGGVDRINTGRHLVRSAS